MKIGITLAILKLSGNIPEEIEELKIADNGFETRCFIDLRIVTGMLKGPDAFFGTKLFIIFSISRDVMGSGLKQSEGLGGIKSRGLLVEVGIESARFLPTLVKNSLNSLAMDSQSDSSTLLFVKILDGKLKLPRLSPIISLMPF